MLGRRDQQRSFFGTMMRLGKQALSKMGFYGKMATEGHKYFTDDDFADMYCPDNGRPSAPPSLLSMARLLQFHDKVSDQEVVERCKYDLRWKTALDLDLDTIEAPFVKSTFQGFRARLTLHANEGLAFEKSVRAAAEAGLLPRKLRLAMDSSPVRGRGAVKDTFNLLSDAIVAVVRAVAAKRKIQAEEVARQAGVERHIEAASIKGTEMVNWDDQEAVSVFLDGLLGDCERAVRLAEQAECATEEVGLLQKVIDQDVEQPESEQGPRIRKGVAQGRTVSVHDSEMRHGHKSTGKKYNGHKAHIAVETSSGVITAVEMTEPSEPEGGQVKSLVEQSEQTTARPVEEGLGDCAYGTRKAIEQAAEANIEMISKMPSAPIGRFGPGDFEVSEDGQAAQCPATMPSAKVKRRKDGYIHEWSPQVCGRCPMKDKCTKSARRTLTVPADFHERRRRERHTKSEPGRRLLRLRVVVEHGLGRLKNLGAGTSRYFGRAKTHTQWLWTAAVANFSLVFNVQEVPAK